jgi:hypothetical protein
VVLTEARAATERWRDVVEERQRSEFDAGVEESKRELESEGRRCGCDRGVHGGFYMGPWERQRGGNDW